MTGTNQSGKVFHISVAQHDWRRSYMLLHLTARLIQAI